MVLLAVTHAHTATHRAFIAREALHLTGRAHNNCVGPFTSNKHVLLLIVFIQASGCVTRYGERN